MKSRSFIDGLATPTVKGSQIILFVLNNIGKLLTVSKGRDKILGLVQHICDLYKQCMLEYIAAYRVKEWPLSIKNSHALQVSVKNARKFLRLLKWIEEIGRVEEKLKNSFEVVILLKVTRHFIGMCYYLVDNALWFNHIGVTSEYLDQNFLENIKDSFSLLRYLLRMIIFSLTSHEKAALEKKLSIELKKSKTTIRFSSNEYNTLESLIKVRSKRRYQSFEMVINILRILMLIKSLKLPGSNYISVIFRCICGIVSGAFSLFKLVTRSNIAY
jgi:Peroxisomal biogenesis factor 11 (PEX11)